MENNLEINREYDDDDHTITDTISESITNVSSVESKINNIDKLVREMRLTYDPLVRPTLVLDLDETIIHTINSSDPIYISDTIIKPNMLVAFRCGQEVSIVFYRPYVVNFLLRIQHYYDIIIYTNASKTYYETILLHLSHICGTNVFKGGYYRTDFTTFNKYLKTGNIDRKRAVILDDRYDVWVEDEDNLILIKQFFGPQNDNYLLDTTLLTVYDALIRIHKSYIDDNDDRDIRQHILKETDNMIETQIDNMGSLSFTDLSTSSLDLDLDLDNKITIIV